MRRSGSSRRASRPWPACCFPSATVFLLLLCNDKEVLGPWVNRPWLNVVSGIIVSILLMMSLVLMITTLFTTINVTDLAVVLGGVLLVFYAIAGVLMLRHRGARPPAAGSRRSTGPTGACRL